MMMSKNKFYGVSSGCTIRTDCATFTCVGVEKTFPTINSRKAKYNKHNKRNYVINYVNVTKC